MSQTLSPDTYDHHSITVLKGLEGVRRRPGMYLGDVDGQGYDHTLFEIADNSIDEAMAGYATHIKVTLHADGSASVQDDGRGIPIGMIDSDGVSVSAATVAMTTLHAGGKFDNGAYKTSGGLHGVGASVVNAVSIWFRIVIQREGYVWTQEFRQGGTPVAPLARGKASKATGTLTHFLLDPLIFGEGRQFDVDLIRARLRKAAYLTPGLEIAFVVEETGEHSVFSATKFSDILDFIAPSEAPAVGGTIEADARVEDEKGGVAVFFAMRYAASEDTCVATFANNISTPKGGTHESGFSAALLRALNAYATAKESKGGKDSKGDAFVADDVREGLAAAIAVRVSEPKFDGQTKERLTNPEARSAVYKVVYDTLKRYLEENAPAAKAIVAHLQQAARARAAAQRAREAERVKRSANGRKALPEKLTPCRETNPDRAEIFLVEGDSAGGTANMGRNPLNQAILPLKGKILNVQKSTLAEALANKEIQSLIDSLGCGYGQNFKLDKVRYHKIIIMTDADVDGSHIATLILTCLHKLTPGLIEAGYVYAAQPPLYRVTKGKQSHYIRDDAELTAFQAERGGDWLIQRFKGLGEMNAQQLRDTTMDPATRTLVRVTYGTSGNKGSEPVIELLMGPKIPPRLEFIQTNGKFAALDV